MKIPRIDWEILEFFGFRKVDTLSSASVIVFGKAARTQQ